MARTRDPEVRRPLSQLALGATMLGTQTDGALLFSALVLTVRNNIRLPLWTVLRMLRWTCAGSSLGLQHGRHLPRSMQRCAYFSPIACVEP